MSGDSAAREIVAQTDRGLPPPVPAPVIREIPWVHLYERTDPNHRFATSSLPGHLIQCMVRGSVRQRVSGQEYVLRSGDLIWYYQDELHEGHVEQVPWSYYSINFIAPDLSPPPFNRRVWRVGPDVVKLFAAVNDAWCNTTLPPIRKAMRVQGQLLLLLSSLTSGDAETFHTDQAARLWWEVERLVREDPSRLMDLSRLEELTRCSASTIARACRTALGVSPIKRIKQIRMGYAQGLVHFSTTSISEIAERVGYGRIHEFSRDYRKTFGMSPTQDRAKIRPGVNDAGKAGVIVG
jgi:AraC-like DNA-binding protein